MAPMRNRGRMWGLAALMVLAVLMWLYATAAVWTPRLPNQRILPTPVAIAIDLPDGELLRLLGGIAAVALTTWVGFRVLRTMGAFVALWVSLVIYLVLYFAAPTRSPQLIYQAHRADFNTIATMAQKGELPDKSPAGNDLSLRLRYLSSNGKATWINGALFVPRQVSFPARSGGFWYVPKGSPVGLDMFGTLCSQPMLIDRNWWVCGPAS